VKSTYDDEADAAYLYLRDGIPVDHSVAVDEHRTVDVAADGTVVGIEIIGASAGVPLLDLVERFDLHQFLPHLRRAEETKYVALETA